MTVREVDERRRRMMTRESRCDESRSAQGAEPERRACDRWMKCETAEN